MAEYYLGLLSGTSMDAIDAAIFDFATHPPTLVASLATPIAPELKDSLRQLCHPGENEINRLGTLDAALGAAFAAAVNSLLEQANIEATAIKAIGSHGQTIRHCPDATPPFTLQIGDPNTIATKTGIQTITDFRRKDIALGGQGAPLAPAFHEYLFRQESTDCFVVNIGGIANVSYLPKNQQQAIVGFDTGPGNTLMDAWIRQHLHQAFDQDGQWASTGTPCPTLLTKLLSDPYFAQAFPKSTGPEHFNLDWLAPLAASTPAADVQHTLMQLTATSISQAIQALSPEGLVYICGGGANNALLMQAIEKALPTFTVMQTDHVGISGDWLEAMLFAWLAKCRLENKAINLSSVTGSCHNTCLGAIYSS